jgi:Zn-dependent protease with chaperone function
MDFFDRQDKARRRTHLLALYFVLAVVCTIAALYLAMAAIFLHQRYQPDTLAWLWHPQLFLGVVGGTLLIIAGGSVYKMVELGSGGGAAVATALGGSLLTPHTTDPDERKLMNVVEEMALASGTPVPEVYVLRAEDGVNAFAAGNTPTDAAVGVTAGCMRLLTRDELQGVIAHEFSHVLNGDMRLNLRLIGMVHGLVCLALIGRVILEAYWRRGRRLGARSRGRGGDPLPLIGVALVVIGSIGVLFARLIKSAIARQREYLADAAAIQFTRNPAGLAGALKKIGGLTEGSRVSAPLAEEASHLFFGNALRESWFGLMSTHPPLTERIKAIEPQFDGVFPPVMPPPRPSTAAKTPTRAGQPRLTYGPGDRARLRDLAARAVHAGAVAAQVGEPRRQHLEYAASLRAALPEDLAAAAQDSLGATTLLYSLLLSPDQNARSKQLEGLAQQLAPTVAHEVARLAVDAVSLPPGAKLALVDLALPALRRLSTSQYRQFRAVVAYLIESDEQIDLFEYTLQKIVARHLEPRFDGTRKPIVQFYALRPLLEEATVLLSILAQVGRNDRAGQEMAFRQGAVTLGIEDAEASLLSFSECSLEQVDAALNKLASAAPAIKRGVLVACAHTVAADGLLEEREAELLRAIADTLDCPLPPFVNPSASGQPAEAAAVQ